MSATQKLSRIRRPLSSNIWRHSAAGLTCRRTREMSTSRAADESPRSASFLAGRSAGSTRNSLRSRITRRVPSPLTQTSSMSSASTVDVPVARFRRSSTGRGVSASKLARSSPSTPCSGLRSHTRPPLAATSEEYRAAGTGTGTTRSARPSGSTTTVTSSTSGPFSSGVLARPCAVGANGDGVLAASGSSCGRVPAKNERSKTCESYTGSKVRVDRNAR